MVIKVTFKTPDVAFFAVEEADIHLVEEKKRAHKLLREWIKDGEYITLEFDTEANTCTPVKV